MTSGVLVLFKS